MQELVFCNSSGFLLVSSRRTEEYQHHVLGLVCRGWGEWIKGLVRGELEQGHA